MQIFVISVERLNSLDSVCLLTLCTLQMFVLLWLPYVIGGHYIFALRFLSSIVYLFFPRLISAATDWISAIHMAWP